MLGDELIILHDVAARFESAGIAYMVTGSMALAVYAEPRMTRDVDIVIALAADDADTIVRLFEQDFHFDHDRVREVSRRGGMFNMIHSATIVKVDCIIRKSTPYRLVEFEHRRRIDIAGQTVDVVAPEDLILSKLDWMRQSSSDLQLRDVRNLLSTVGDLDWEYLRHWANQLDLSDMLDEAQR